MAGGVDNSKWKPRRLRGTPANIFHRKLALSILAVSVTLTLIYDNLPFVKKGKEELFKNHFLPDEDAADRKMLMMTSLVAPRRSDQIKQILEQKKDIETER